MIFVPGLEMEAYEAAWKAHLVPVPPWKAYIEQRRHEDMEKLKLPCTENAWQLFWYGLGKTTLVRDTLTH